MSKQQKYEWFAGGCAPELYPTKIFFGDFILPDGSRRYIPPASVFVNGWGSPGSTVASSNDILPLPKAIDIIWYSILEDKFYSVEAPLPVEKLEELFKQRHPVSERRPLYDVITVGMAPYGDLAVWAIGIGITTVVAWVRGVEEDVEWTDFLPESPISREEYVDFSKKDEKEAYANYLENGHPDRYLFVRYMQRFNYRITPKFLGEEAVFVRIRKDYYNGEHNSLKTDSHTVNAMRAKLKKIILDWHVGNSLYSGYFWTDEHKIIETFAAFYGDDAEKEGELVIEVGESNDEFRLFLQNNDGTEVVEIPFEELEVLVFKDRFESYRSPNYSRGRNWHR